MTVKKTVIYARYSSDMQRRESCSDQERDVRHGLRAGGIDTADAVVINDEAESGTKTSRDGFSQLLRMIAAGEVGILAVDDQSRLTRADNAYAFITDLVFAGGRFISTGEAIDTAVPGWELKVKVLELHHSQTVRDLQHRVRRGQLGRVLDDGSAGDFPYGYESFYKDADWQAQLARRGPKPKKGLRVCEGEAKWVRQVFDWFVSGKSIGWIARELTRLGVPKGGRASKPGWHPQQVHRMLNNTKYVGKWTWGETVTVRNSSGKTKQVPVPPGQEVPRDRPHLRIVDQDVWEKARVRMAELVERFGYKPGQQRRGPKPPASPTDVYPRSLLGGVLVCGACGAAMWYHGSGDRRYYACSGRKKGLCGASFQVPAERAEQSVIGVLTDLLIGWPEWVCEVYRRTRNAVAAAAERVPAERERDEKRRAERRRQIDNLVTALADGSLTSAAVSQRLATAELEVMEIEGRLAAAGPFDPVSVRLPGEAWVRTKLDSWATSLTDESSAAAALRNAVDRISAESVVAAGKKRGFVRLRFRVKSWRVFMAAVGDHLHSAVRRLVPPPADGDESPEFTLDLGQPTRLDQWAPQIAAWRADGVTWPEIVRRTGMDLNRVYVAWKRYTQIRGEGTSAA